MKNGDKGISVQQGNNHALGVNFRDPLQREQSSSMVELASEFGVTATDVRKIKKHLERS